MIKKLLLTSALVVSFATTVSAKEMVKKKEQHTTTHSHTMHHGHHTHKTEHKHLLEEKTLKPHCASNLKVTLGGDLNTQFGFRSQRGNFKYTSPSAVNTANNTTTNTSDKLNNFALVNDTKLKVNVDGETDGGLMYGGHIKLNADTSLSKEEHFSRNYNNIRRIAEETMMYLGGEFGRLEMGSYRGASLALKTDAASFAAATGGVDGDAKYWWNQYAMSEATASFARLTADAFLVSPNLPTNELGRYGINSRNAAKITYFTPNLSGFKAGISYTPDQEMFGTIAQSGNVAKTYSDFDANRLPTFRNIVEGGVAYEYVNDDNMGFKIAWVGQYGDAKKFRKDPTNNNLTGKKYRKLHAWEAGANLMFSGFKVGGSYGTWGKSGMLKDSTIGKAKATKYWTAGVGYEYGPANVSLTYLNSKNGGYQLDNTGKFKSNKLEQYSLGFDYKVAPGLVPYAEVTAYKFKDHYLDTTNNTKVKSNKGTIVLVGSKLSF